MAPIAISPESSPRLVPAPTKTVVSRSVCHFAVSLNLIINRPHLADWQIDLEKNGFAVIKNTIPRDRAVGYQEKAYEWLSSFGTALCFTDPST